MNKILRDEDQMGYQEETLSKGYTKLKAFFRHLKIDFQIVI